MKAYKAGIVFPKILALTFSAVLVTGCLSDSGSSSVESSQTLDGSTTNSDISTSVETYIAPSDISLGTTVIGENTSTTGSTTGGSTNTDSGSSSSGSTDSSGSVGGSLPSSPTIVDSGSSSGSTSSSSGSSGSSSSGSTSSSSGSSSDSNTSGGTTVVADSGGSTSGSSGSSSSSDSGTSNSESSSSGSTSSSSDSTSGSTSSDSPSSGSADSGSSVGSSDPNTTPVSNPPVAQEPEQPQGPIYIDDATEEQVNQHVVACPRGNGKSQAPCLMICHVPPGNPAARHTIIIGAAAFEAHAKHGKGHGHEHMDYLGQCIGESSVANH